MILRKVGVLPQKYSRRSRPKQSLPKAIEKIISQICQITLNPLPVDMDLLLDPPEVSAKGLLPQNQCPPFLNLIQSCDE